MTDLVPLSSEIAGVFAAEQDAGMVQMWLHGRPASIRRVYEPIVSEFLQQARKPLREITIQDLQSFQSSLSALAATTQSKKLSAIKSLLTYAHKAGYLVVNVGVVLHMPKIKNTWRSASSPKSTYSG